MCSWLVKRGYVGLLITLVSRSYTLVCADLRIHAGIALFINDSFSISSIVFVEPLLIDVICMYRSPRSPPADLYYIESYLSTVVCRADHIICMGNFNVLASVELNNFNLSYYFCLLGRLSIRCRLLRVHSRFYTGLVRDRGLSLCLRCVC